MGAVAIVSPGSSVGLAVLVVLGVTQAGRVGSRWRTHAEAVFLEVQAAIVVAEAAGTAPGHTMAVVEIVDRLSLDRDPAERRSLIRAAWLHALAYAKDGRVCNGTSLSPELSYSTRSIALLGLADRRRLLPRAGVLSHTEDPDAQLVAGACAHVERPARLRAADATGHLVFTYGITPKIATRITSCPVPMRSLSLETLRSIPGG
jgi:hypothetical protein